jgi:hypothetical protein
MIKQNPTNIKQFIFNHKSCQQWLLMGWAFKIPSQIISIAPFYVSNYDSQRGIQGAAPPLSCFSD